VLSVCFSPDGKRLASGSTDGRVIIGIRRLVLFKWCSGRGKQRQAPRIDGTPNILYIINNMYSLSPAELNSLKYCSTGSRP
ncbi:hypothetical protein BDR04DRAFT_1017465, partial [Suillus decipiens]